MDEGTKGQAQAQSSTATVAKGTMQDICRVEDGVEVLIRHDSKVLWVNVDGVCVLRISCIPVLEVVGP